MIPTKTSKEIAIYLHDITGFIPLMFSKQDQPNELAKLENEKWVSVDVLQQKLQELDGNGCWCEDERCSEYEENILHKCCTENCDVGILRKAILEFSVELEPEEAKK